MAEFDLDALLAEISPDQPCGEDVSYDATFGDLERAAQCVAAQSIGDSVKPGKEPGWA
jgi:type VI secretion system protein ImpA